MSNLKIYGVPLSRAYRALWNGKRTGAGSENVQIDFADGSAKVPIAGESERSSTEADKQVVVGFSFGNRWAMSISRQEARQRLAAEDDGGRGGGDPMELLGND